LTIMRKRRASERPEGEAALSRKTASQFRRRDQLAVRSSAVIACATAHEAISSLVDGEISPITDEATRAHLASCRDCQEFEAGVVSLRRQMSVRVLAPRPDRTTEILALLGFPSHPSQVDAPRARLKGYPERVFWVRATQWAAGLAPLVIAVPALALGAFTHLHLVGSHVLTPCTSYLVRHHLGR
jgi:anti-sigma factor RsiW